LQKHCSNFVECWRCGLVEGGVWNGFYHKILVIVKPNNLRSWIKQKASEEIRKNVKVGIQSVRFINNTNQLAIKHAMLSMCVLGDATNIPRTTWILWLHP
jgi:hypothetical protein